MCRGFLQKVFFHLQVVSVYNLLVTLFRSLWISIIVINLDNMNKNFHSIARTLVSFVMIGYRRAPYIPHR
jgi:hypothetical protein